VGTLRVAHPACCAIDNQFPDAAAPYPGYDTKDCGLNMNDTLPDWLFFMQLFLFIFLWSGCLLNFKFFKKKFPGQPLSLKVFYGFIFKRENWHDGYVKFLALYNAFSQAYFVIYIILFFLVATGYFDATKHAQ
jgi:hypothetical protein